MSSQKVVPQPGSLELTRARITVLGYGRAAREQALGLRRAGNDVAIGLRLGGMSWVRARKDGFEAHAPTVLVGGAEVVVVLVPDDEQASVYCHAIEPLIAPNALLVFSRGLALGTRVFEPSKHDVVFVTGGPAEGGPTAGVALGRESTDPNGRTHCRVAVHHDATGRALERAIAYARAAFGANAEVGTTTVAAEVDAELSSMIEHAGSVQELSASVERLLARVRDNHAPEEAKVAFYEGLRELVAKRMYEHRVHDRGSDVSLRFWPAPSGGRA